MPSFFHGSRACSPPVPSAGLPPRSAITPTTRCMARQKHASCIRATRCSGWPTARFRRSLAPRAARVTATPATARFDASSSTIAPSRLAQSAPPAGRAQAQAFFERTLETYHQIESRFGLPRNDLAGAVAAFVAGNYIAYRDEPFPDRYFKPLVQQIRGALESGAVLQGSSNADKQELYEHMAILGTYMALTREALQKQPDPQLLANMKHAARDYLQQGLKLDPERMQLTDQGLVVN